MHSSQLNLAFATDTCVDEAKPSALLRLGGVALVCGIQIRASATAYHPTGERMFAFNESDATGCDHIHINHANIFLIPISFDDLFQSCVAAIPVRRICVRSLHNILAWIYI